MRSGFCCFSAVSTGINVLYHGVVQRYSLVGREYMNLQYAVKWKKFAYSWSNYFADFQSENKRILPLKETNLNAAFWEQNMLNIP